MAKSGLIIAIGGGGATHGMDPELDRFCLDQLRPWASIGFVGMASRDDPDKLARFYRRFEGAASVVSHLPETADRAETERWLTGKDMVYFGGGNSLRLLDWLRSRAVVPLFLDANRAGTVLAGVSAGALCWCESFPGGSAADGFAPTRGLGVLRASLCPHASADPERMAAFGRAVAEGGLPSGYAIDDGACVLFRGGHFAGAFSGRAGAGVRFLTGKAGRLEQTDLLARSAA